MFFTKSTVLTGVGNKSSGKCGTNSAVLTGVGSGVGFTLGNGNGVGFAIGVGSAGVGVTVVTTGFSSRGELSLGTCAGLSFKRKSFTGFRPLARIQSHATMPTAKTAP